MAEFYVEQQGWVRWPKVLIMCRKDGRGVTHRRYVPEVETGEGMGITDELREWWLHKFPVMDKELHKDFTAIADRIDAEHERAMEEARAEGMQEGFVADKGPREFIELPKDADGEPWRLGDELMVEGEVCEVVGIGGKTIFYAFGDGVEWTIAHNNRHHHAPTVEDVLRQVIACANNGTHVHGALDTEQIVAEYAARLQLREDA